MGDNFDSLLRTDDSRVETAQLPEDVLKNSRWRIKNICKAFCLPAKSYDPRKTVTSIENYVKEKTNRERILYSEISSFVYGLQAEEQGNFATNVECLLAYTFDENNNIDDLICKIILKIYDHFQLSVHQKNLNSETNEVVKSHLAESIAEANKAIENSAKRAKNAEKEYITILGIFASIVLAFVGGLTFSTSVLQNIDAISIYRLILVIDLLALVIVNAIYVLIKFICHINDKDDKLFGVKWFNIVCAILGFLVVFAWLFDVISLAKYINSYMPWSK